MMTPVYPVPRLVPEIIGSKILGLYHVKIPLNKQGLKFEVQLILDGTWPRGLHQYEFLQAWFGRFYKGGL